MFPEWMGNGWALTYFTCVFFIISHLISYFLKSEKVRFLLTYAAIFMGGAALLTSFHSASSAMSAAKMKLASERVDRAGVEVKRAISATKNTVCGLSFISGPDSPPNFIEIETDRKSMCDMFTRLELYGSQEWNPQSEFTPPNVGLSSIKSLVFRVWANDLQYASDEHQKARSEVILHRPQSWLFWTALEPFVISASWSLGLALMIPHRRRQQGYHLG